MDRIHTVVKTMELSIGRRPCQVVRGGLHQLFASQKNERSSKMTLSGYFKWNPAVREQHTVIKEEDE